MDFKAWNNQLRSFIEALPAIPGKVEVTNHIAPPLTPAALEVIRDQWPNGIPETLMKFWTEGAESVDCHYFWSPSDDELPLLMEIFEANSCIYGGPQFISAEEIYPGNSGIAQDTASEKCYRKSWGEFGYEQWCKAAIFAFLQNGDCLGLDLEKNPNDPPVVYLLHDDEQSQYISQSFTSFLENWAKVSFIGPEFWLLDLWVDPERGEIDVTKHHTEQLAKLLSPRVPGETINSINPDGSPNSRSTRIIKHRQMTEAFTEKHGEEYHAAMNRMQEKVNQLTKDPKFRNDFDALMREIEKLQDEQQKHTDNLMKEFFRDQDEQE